MNGCSRVGLRDGLGDEEEKKKKRLVLEFSTGFGCKWVDEKTSERFHSLVCVCSV